MLSQTREDLVHRLDDLNCQIDCLAQAVNLQVIDQDEDYRLNSLIVKRAQVRKNLQNLENTNSTSSFLTSLRRFSRQPKKICDYFPQ